jgi:hypothetical protein
MSLFPTLAAQRARVEGGAPSLSAHSSHRTTLAKGFCTAMHKQSGIFTTYPQRSRFFLFRCGPPCGTLDVTQPHAAAAWCFPAREAAKGFAELTVGSQIQTPPLRRKRLQPAGQAEAPSNRFRSPLGNRGRSAAGSQAPRALLRTVESPERRLASPGLIFSVRFSQKN